MGLSYQSVTVRSGRMLGRVGHQLVELDVALARVQKHDPRKGHLRRKSPRRGWLEGDTATGLSTDQRMRRREAAESASPQGPGGEGSRGPLPDAQRRATAITMSSARAGFVMSGLSPQPSGGVS